MVMKKQYVVKVEVKGQARYLHNCRILLYGQDLAYKFRSVHMAEEYFADSYLTNYPHEVVEYIPDQILQYGN